QQWLCYCEAWDGSFAPVNPSAQRAGILRGARPDHPISGPPLRGPIAMQRRDPMIAANRYRCGISSAPTRVKWREQRRQLETVSFRTDHRAIRAGQRHDASSREASVAHPTNAIGAAEIESTPSFYEHV